MDAEASSGSQDLGEACANCGAPANARFCGTCGQPVDVDPKSMAHFLRSFLEEALSLDGKLLRSLGALILRPGLLTQEWRAGRRAAWSHPFRMYLLTSLAFFSASQFLPTDFSFSVGIDWASDPALRDAQHAEQRQALVKVAPQVLILLVPVLALLLRLAFRQTKFLVEHLVHAMHLQSFLFVLMFAIVASSAAGLQPGRFFGPFLLGVLGVFFCYMLLSSHRVYAERRAWSFTGAAAVFLGYTIVSVISLSAAVVQFSADPLAPLREVEERYWQARAERAAGDTATSAARARTSIRAYRRLAAHLLGPTERAHVAELYLMADSTTSADRTVEEGLVAYPDNLLLLRAATLVADAEGDEERATVVARAYLRAHAALGVDTTFEARHREDLQAMRSRAEALTMQDSLSDSHAGRVRP